MKKQLQEVEIRNDRLILIQHNGVLKQEIDVTGVWNFAKEVLQTQQTLTIT